MNQERLNGLIDTLNKGNITQDELKELMMYYNSFQVGNTWDSGRMGDYEEAKARIYEKIIYQEKRRSVRPLRVWIWTAASILLFVLSWLSYSTWFNPDKLIHVSTDKTSKEIFLPDGTRVVLNINSHISYPRTFTSARREVKFEGEGYFDVAKDSLHPFVIETDLIKVKVLGTVFNLKSYKDDPRVETSLLEGRVALLSKDEKTTFSILKPNQKFTAEKQVLAKAKQIIIGGDISVEEVQYMDKSEKSPVDLAWKEGKFAFSSATLVDIAGMIKRQYGVNVKIINSQAADYKYTAVFDGESIDEILKALSLVKQFNYRREGNDLIIY